MMRIATILGMWALLWATPGSAEMTGLERFAGTYVGRAIVADQNGKVQLERDIEFTIEPLRRTGLRMRWVNIDLVDGRRDVKGIKRHIGESVLTPSSDGKYLIETDDSGPFRDRADLQPMSGDAIRWAQADANSISMMAFVLLPDGTYELQINERRLTADGMEVIFQRVEDGTVVRTGSGHAIRVDP